MHDAWKDVAFPTPYKNDQKRFTEEDHQRNRQHYAAMLENIDRQIGLFIKLVEERGELDSTLFVLCSDHGEMLGDHNKWGKCSWHEPSIHVPLVVVGPGVQKGVSSDTLVVLHDLTDTFIEAGNAAPLDGADSKSLWPVLTGDTDEHRERVVSALGGWRCVVTKSHKYVTGYKETPEILIALDDDPQEDNNIAEGNEEIIRKMR
jgi:arylsulfatase A-like enzyme